jgi:hypothetical protein
VFEARLRVSIYHGFKARCEFGLALGGHARVSGLQTQTGGFLPVIIQRTHVDTATRHKIDDQKVKIDG